MFMVHYYLASLDFYLTEILRAKVYNTEISTQNELITKNENYVYVKKFDKVDMKFDPQRIQQQFCIDKEREYFKMHI